MRSSPSRFLLLSLASVSAACVHARGIPIGQGASPRPAGCELRCERTSPSEAQARWQQVGDVCVSNGGVPNPDVEDAYQPGDMHDALTDQACALGGEIVTPIGLCTNGKSDGVEFGVYVPRS
jgi:hypothetical protein